MSGFSDYVHSTLIRDMDEARQPLIVGCSDTISDAIDKMANTRTGCVLVTDDAGKLVGIFTERDVLLRVLGESESLFDPVEKHMTKDVVTATLSDTLNDAIHKLDRGQRRHLPIVEDGKPIKILSSRSLVRHFAELFPAEILNLPPDHNQQYAAPDGA